MELLPWTYALLFVVGLVAGTVDAIAGGGGIITLPVLLNLGLPVPIALGTNKLGSSFGSVSAAFHFVRQGIVDLRACKLGIGMTLAGSLAGAIAVQQMDTGLLQMLIPWLLAAIVVYSIFKPDVGELDRAPRLRAPQFFTAFGLVLGFYDGFFGPGAGSFWTISLVLVKGYNFTKATGYTKVMNAASNLSALVFFLLAGTVHIGAGLALGAGQMIGARIGTGLVVKKGARFVRPIFLTMVVLTVARLVYVSYARP